jgi:hypothetical protein
MRDLGLLVVLGGSPSPKTLVLILENIFLLNFFWGQSSLLYLPSSLSRVLALDRTVHKLAYVHVHATVLVSLIT